METTDATHRKDAQRDPLFVVLIQWFLPVSFTVSMVGIIGWIISLILLSAKLDDVFSASMGVSIVAIPVFLVLLSVFWYVFLGVFRNQDEDPQDGASEREASEREGTEGAEQEERHVEGGEI